MKYLALLIVPTGLILNLLNKPDFQLLHKPTSDSKYFNSGKKLNELLKEDINKKNISILTEKSKYKLTVFYEMTPIKSYPIALSSNPIDDKLKDGDGCTPEGKFKVKAHFKHKKFQKFIWLNYPTIDSWKKYGNAKSKGILKITDSIGSNIGIQGLPENDDSLEIKTKNLSDGSIYLKNNDINELFDFIKDGITVEIIK